MNIEKPTTSDSPQDPDPSKILAIMYVCKYDTLCGITYTPKMQLKVSSNEVN